MKRIRTFIPGARRPGFIMYLLAACLFLTSLPAYSQNFEKNTAWMDYLEELSESEIDPVLVENLFEELSFLSENPFDLHTVTKQDLERLPFLSSSQIENLLYYVYRHTPLASIYELQNVDDLDMQTIRYLLPFVYIGTVEKKENFDPKRMVRYGRHLFLLRSDYGFQEKSGYKKPTEEERLKNPNKYYLGENYYLSVKYDFEYKNKVMLALTGEKDTGEAFLNKNHKGFDFYSGSLVLTDLGIVNSLHLGDYRISMGQGLILNTGFSTGKTSDVVNINKSATPVKRHFSTGESGFFRGAAIDLKCTPFLDCQVFYSHQKMDANADSFTVLSFKTDGYNRTPSDLEKRRQAVVNLIGAHLRWQKGRIYGGLEGVYYDFGKKTLNPEVKAYNLFYLRGKNNFNLGGYYGFRFKNIAFTGETALSKNGGIASLHTLDIHPSTRLNLIVSYRNYSVDYQALFGKALSESSQVQNESGIYTGMKLQFFRHWTLNAYLDCFRFPWFKYGIDAPSSGTDALLQLNFAPQKNWGMNLRYKRKEKSKNKSQDRGPVVLLPFVQHKWRYQFDYRITNEFGLKTQVDYILYINPDKTQSAGRSWSQLFSFCPENKRIQLDCALSYFNAGDWNNRIPVYEKNILYAFNFPSYYGKGLRYYAVFRWKITNPLSFYLKLASTHYYDRETIGSGLEEIAGKEKTDIYALLRWKF